MTAATDSFMVCVHAHSSDAGTFARGTRVRADHPAVNVWRDAWLPDGIPESEWPSDPADVLGYFTDRGEAEVVLPHGRGEQHRALRDVWGTCGAR